MSASEQVKSSTATGAKESRDPEEIRDDIEETREELGDTVAAMAEKTDVKQQAQRLAKENPMPLAFAGVFLAGVIFGRLLSR
jgi:F0F1-type ATP synthase assembly protein I